MHEGYEVGYDNTWEGEGEQDADLRDDNLWIRKLNKTSYKHKEDSRYCCPG